MRKGFILFHISQVILLLALTASELKASVDTLRLEDYGIIASDDRDDAEALNRLIQRNQLDSLVLVFGDGKYKFGTQIRAIFDQHVKWIGSSHTEVYPAKNFKNYSLIKGYDLDLVRIIVNGMNRIAKGIVIGHRAKIINSKIINFNNPKNEMSRGLIYGEKGVQLYIYKTEFINIGGLEDGKVGNGIGSHRAIVVKGRNVLIDSCRFKHIYGSEDGDILHINSHKNHRGEWTSLGHIIIKNSTFDGFGKRAVKVQASGVVILNCKFLSDNESSANGPRNVVSLMGAGNAVIGCDIDVNAIAHAIIIYSDRNTIKGNIIFIHNKIKSSRVRGSMIHGIKVYGNYNIIELNKIQFNSLGVPIQIKQGKGNIIANNLVEYIKFSIVSDKKKNSIYGNAIHKISK